MKLNDIILAACVKYDYPFIVEADGHVSLKGRPGEHRSKKMKRALKVLGEVLEEMSD
jgi:hypothetical protein